jgi:hypothetical protein
LLSELNSKINYESSLSIIIEKLENQGQSLTVSDLMIEIIGQLFESDR